MWGDVIMINSGGKVLFVVSSYIQSGSSANLRNNALIEGLCSNGFIVDVISREPDKKAIIYDGSMKLPPIRKFIYVIKNAHVSEKRTEQGNKVGLKSRILPLIIKVYTSISIWDTWYLKVKKLKDIKLNDNYDIMISSSDPKSSHYLAHKIYKKNKDKIGKWIQYWGDPFLLDINQSAGSKIRTKVVERSLIASADKVVYVSPLTLEKQKQLYPIYSEKMFFLPIPVRKKKVENNKEIDLKSQLRIGYFGAYKNRDRNIMPLYNAINNSEHFLEIIGPSDIVLNSTDHVFVHEQIRVPVSEIEKKEQEMDVLVCICNKSGTQIPGKAYHYAMTNKYILIILDGENADRIREYFEGYNRYIFCKNNEESILKTVNELKDDLTLRTPCRPFLPQSIAKDFVL